MLTIEEFNKLPNGTRFRMGVISNSPTGVFMTRDESLPLLRFVAIKGFGNDWTLYIGSLAQSYSDVMDFGDKSNTEDYIRRCVPCDDEVWKLYRT